MGSGEVQPCNLTRFCAFSERNSMGLADAPEGEPRPPCGHCPLQGAPKPSPRGPGHAAAHTQQGAERRLVRADPRWAPPGNQPMKTGRPRPRRDHSQPRPPHSQTWPRPDPATPATGHAHTTGNTSLGSQPPQGRATPTDPPTPTPRPGPRSRPHQAPPMPAALAHRSPAPPG